MSYANLAFYKFVTIPNPNALKDELLEICQQFEVSGSIIVAKEGINGCIAGQRAKEWGNALQNHPLLSPAGKPLSFKVSYSPSNPYKRMLIKVKDETIALKVPWVAPQSSTGPYVEAQQLKEWLDKGENIILIDTRNTYEVSWGTFSGAITPPLDSFNQFPQWFDQWQQSTEIPPDAKVVTFCTGGIRCEKATAYMLEKGVEAYQIEGGILSYLEATQSEKNRNHWEGELFVFDGRVALDKDLKPTQTPFCSSCYDPMPTQTANAPSVCFRCTNDKERRRQRGLEKLASSLAKRKARSLEQNSLHQNPMG